MDIIRRSLILILFLVFLFSTQNYFILSLGTMNIICKPSERTALLSFKQHLKNSSYGLSSWSSENCCRWAGVVCSNTTDHVVQLQLHDLGLGGELNPSLQELKQLRHLDLSLNNFEGIRIPGFLGSLQSLRYLNLSNAGFGGIIPHQIGNLSNLRYLDIRNSQNLRYLDIRNLQSSYEKLVTVVDNFQWISHLSSLEHLDLSWADLENVSSNLFHVVSISNLFHVVSMLPSLLVLRLSDCHLSGAALPTSLSHVNFTSLEVLDLSNNYGLNSTLPEWLYSLTNLQQLYLTQNYLQGTISPSIGNLTKLTLLDLSSNKFEGEIPITLGNLCKLQRLDLSFMEVEPLFSEEGSGWASQLSGPIPLSIGRLSSLKELNLYGNKLNGSLPESLGNLSNLVSLIISSNAFEGIVSEIHFANLTNLQTLSMNSPSLVLKVSPEWVPPFSLVSAKLRTCQLGPGFPMWLRTQKNLTKLDLSRTGISGTIPTWFWNLSSQNSEFSVFDLSYNDLHGELPKVINAVSALSLKSNQFNGQLPRVTSNVRELDLSNNSFSGSISAFLCNPPPTSSSENNNLLILDLSNNILSGNLSDCWVYWASLEWLRLGGNKITGKIPNSMSSLLNLQELDLSDNSLSGNIPSYVGSLLNLYELYLSNNNLSGEFPSSLRNCTLLRSIDLGENGFTGILPIWLGESLSNLQYLLLGSNKFYGEIPLQLCHLASIRVLDIAHNDLRGSIPRCFNNFSELTTKEHGYKMQSNGFGEFVEKTRLVVKGRKLDYYSISRALLMSLDLSKNNLSGEIPEELTSLIGLVHLNLSDNRLTGKIPKNIGNMSSLEHLDFSKNRFSGVIPQSIVGISSLSYLDVSYNNLSGKIPLGTQLQSFDESSFIGNQELCGLPLKKCEEPTQKPGDNGDGDGDIGDRADEEDWFEMKWFYVSMGVGFVFGFWVFCGVLVLKKSWRIAYFRFLDDMKDKICLLF